ncbi:MAG: hypothetical protein JW850_14015 [Thermoflexales bacterium]|nr:hypothetical protein [Thermoflexales bacterium]
MVKAFAQAFHPGQWLSGLAAGLVTGIIAVTVSAAFAALIFAGPLSSYVPAAIWPTPPPWFKPHCWPGSCRDCSSPCSCCSLCAVTSTS